ncbi:phage tail assembly chaperone [Pseudomonas sp. YQ_5]|uniref:phage tail assembly chaperone n=1 Tax=Pseudomonas sp. YQ_5 TaxID=3367229 RepID=UPI00370B03C4
MGGVITGEIALLAERLDDIVTGRDLEDEFSAEAIADLVPTCTGAPKAYASWKPRRWQLWLRQTELIEEVRPGPRLP